MAKIHIVESPVLSTVRAALESHEALEALIRGMVENGVTPSGVAIEDVLPLLFTQLKDVDFMRALGELMGEFRNTKPEDRRSRKVFVRYVDQKEYQKWVESHGGRNGRMISTLAEDMEFKSVIDAAEALGVTAQYLRQLFSAMKRATREVLLYENKCIRVRGVTLAYEDDYIEGIESGYRH
jgi:hypothetical protein